MQLDLGCGAKKREDCIGVDWSDSFNIDVKHDLNVYPYPFEDNSVDKIYLDNVLEHLSDVVKTIEECHRILRPGGIIEIKVPYFRSKWAFIDPTHIHYFGYQSFDYFDNKTEIGRRYKYSRCNFLILNRIFNLDIKSRFIKSMIVKIANKYPIKYETYMSHILPLDDLTFILCKECEN